MRMIQTIYFQFHTFKRMCQICFGKKGLPFIFILSLMSFMIIHKFELIARYILQLFLWKISFVTGNKIYPFKVCLRKLNTNGCLCVH